MPKDTGGLELHTLSKRSRTISASCPSTTKEITQLSPTGSDVATHHLRSRKQIWLPASLLGTTAEDELTPARSRCRNTPSPVKLPSRLRSPSPVKNCGRNSVKGTDNAINDEVTLPNKFQGKNLKIIIDNSTNVNHHTPLSPKNSGSCSSRNSFKPIETLKLDLRSPSPTKHISSNNRHSPKTPQSPVKESNFAAKTLTVNIKRRRVKRKRLSAEEKLIEDNKAYYKVEVLNSKLRSTGYYLSQRELELSRINGSVDNSPCPGNSGDDAKNEMKPNEKEPVVVRFKKVRKSELTILSDEAESFMFGEPVRKERETPEETSVEESKKTSEECEKKIIKIKKEEIVDENSLGSCSVESNCSVNRKRRRTHAEMFIHDNLDYYKFEISNSRLRFHGSSCSPSPHCKSENLDNESKKTLSSSQEVKTESKTETKSEDISSNMKDEKENDEAVTADVSEGNVEDIQYSFEMIPQSESWYQTYRRQDTCNEYYYPSYTDYPKRLLPYEYPSSERHHYLKRERRLAYKRRKERFLKLLDDKPRKSPRCHASTLAIMSSIMRRKPRDSPDKQQKSSENENNPKTPVPLPPPPPLNVQEEESCSSVPETVCIPEIRIETKLPESSINYKDIAENISELFSRMYNESNDDRYLQTLKSIIKCLESPTESDSVTPVKSSKSKSKSIKSSPNTKHVDPSVDVDELCLPVDPNVLVEAGDINTCILPGPTVDVISLIDNYRHSTSIERADYEHMHPRAVDALRALTVDNSSDCGGSSTCEGLSFFEDGRMCKRKYRKKKRNLTGWPLGRPRRRVVKKDDETTTPVNRRRGGGRKKANTSSESADVERSDTVVSSENIKNNLCDDNKKEDMATVCDDEKNTSCSVSENVESSVVTATVPVSSLTRTVSLDSSPYSNNKNSEYQPCYIKVKKIAPDCLTDCKKEVLHSRHLRSSSSSDIFVSSPVKHLIVEDNSVDSSVTKKIPHKRKRPGNRWARSYSLVRKFR